MKANLCGVVLVVAGILAAASPARAHHGNASFDTSKVVTLTGTVTDYIWANPHCFLKFDAKDDTGAVRNWAVEVSNPTDMTKRGWSRLSFKVGDQVTVSLQAVKSGAPVGRLTKVVLANGTTLGGGAELGAPPAAPAP